MVNHSECRVAVCNNVNILYILSRVLVFWCMGTMLLPSWLFGMVVPLLVAWTMLLYVEPG